MDYYFRTQDEPRPLNEAKLLLLGRGNVGKTSLVNQLVHERFDKDEKRTDGIQITNWPIQLRGQENVRLNIWDFGGQEIMHQTHQFFLSQRSLYLLVLNGRGGGEDADADYWLKYIESFGKQSPVIVVLNKTKEHPFDVDRSGLQRKYPFIRDFIRTDCESGLGIKSLRRLIERETDRLEHLRDAFPAAWFAIKDHLGGMKQNYLSYDQYRRACARLGEKEEAAQDSLAGHLDDLGIALNFRDDPRLHDTHVLNPHWLTNGIYKLLNAPRLEKQKGELRLDDARLILDGRVYRREMHRFLFDLMKKFELCFSFPEDECHYLIPQLLDKQEPQAAGDFDPHECLNFQYHYEVMPEGILPRFIVRSRTLSDGPSRWRSGAILAFEGCRALVKADTQDKKVFVSVSGPGLARRRLLAVIRSDFDRIHGDIHLKPQEMVPVPDHPAVVVSYSKLQVLEQRGVAELTEVVGDDVVILKVSDLLNGVDLEGTRRKETTMDERRRAARLFYSYSHKDEGLRDELQTHLKILQRQGTIESWHDRDINAGEEWKAKIDENLERADIILLLVSADFIASDYCYAKEMTRAMERHQSGEAHVIPISVRQCNWSSAPFGDLQALPRDKKAVTSWANKDEAWTDVSQGIERAVASLASLRARAG